MSKAQKIKQFFSGTPSKSDERKIIMPLAKAINASLDDKGYEEFRDKMLDIIGDELIYYRSDDCNPEKDDVIYFNRLFKEKCRYYDKEFYYGGPSVKDMHRPVSYTHLTLPTKRIV